MLQIIWQGPRVSQTHMYCVLLATPMDTTHYMYVLSAHVHNLAQCVGKGRPQTARIIELFDHKYRPYDNGRTSDIFRTNSQYVRPLT